MKRSSKRKRGSLSNGKNRRERVRGTGS
uniref:Uncharacterized protein n=1 Tax=Rhizophora mucronata TaxID=61149 RepID=A0A2P2JFQ9_RHIMU